MMWFLIGTYLGLTIGYTIGKITAEDFSVDEFIMCCILSPVVVPLYFVEWVFYEK